MRDTNSGLSPKAFVRDTNSGLSPKAFVRDTKSGLSLEGICANYYNRAMSRRHLNEELYPVKFRRFGSPAIGLGILKSKSPTLSKPPFGTILVELRNGMYRTTRLLWVMDPLDLYNLG